MAVKVDPGPEIGRFGLMVRVGDRVQNAGLRVQGAGFRVQVAWCRVQGSGWTWYLPTSTVKRMTVDRASRLARPRLRLDATTHNPQPSVLGAMSYRNTYNL